MTKYSAIVAVVIIVLWNALFTYLVILAAENGLTWLSFLIVIVNFVFVANLYTKSGENRAYGAINKSIDKLCKDKVESKDDMRTGLN